MNSKPHLSNNSKSAEVLVQEFLGAGQSQISSSQDTLTVTLANFWQIIKDGKWGILALMLLGLIGGILKAVSETPVYQARLTMAVEPSMSHQTNINVFDPYAYRFYETQYELLKSRSVAERVVDRLNLVERQDVQRLLVSPSMLRSLAIEVSKLTGIQLVDEVEVSPKKVDLGPAEAQQKKACLLYTSDAADDW